MDSHQLLSVKVVIDIGDAGNALDELVVVLGKQVLVGHQWQPDGAVKLGLETVFQDSLGPHFGADC